jgi:ADP-dependent NAD(P)H-hydrate dehydratase / NAD(P)H-hydrate epimerase
VLAVLTPEEMAAVDRDASEPTEVLVRRAAGAVARRALGLLGGGYGRRVVVVAGPGNNGADGRVAAELLGRAGVRVAVVDALDGGLDLPEADLVIDAAFGTGFRGAYEAPDPRGAPVLAVDIPSGVDGTTGLASGAPGVAIETVTFAALKPGLLLGDGPALAGLVTLANIGLEVGRARTHLVEDDDIVAWVPARPTSSHKWRHAVCVVAGSPGMTGAAHLCAAGAMRAGAGYVQLCSPEGAAASGDHPPPLEVVGRPLQGDDWSASVIAGSDRFAAVAIGPGLGTDRATIREVRAVVAGLPRPLVVDGDGLTALGEDAASLLRARSSPTVLTPHDGEFARLSGSPPGEDRIAAARDLAVSCRSTVLLKGPTTVVADPDGSVLLVRAGDERLATAGTGDVLTGLVAAHLALGAPPARAAAAAAQLHGRAAMLGPRLGLVASDLPALVAGARTFLAGRSA